MKGRWRFLAASLMPIAALLPLAAQAQGLPALTAAPAPGGGTTYSLPLTTLLLLAGLAFLPAAVLVMSSFTRIIIVLALLRSALGTPSAPPTPVLAGLALFLSLFVMAPVLDKLYTDAYQPLAESRIGFEQALERSAAPMKAFMLRQVREPDLSLFAKLSKLPKVDKPEDLPMRVVIPAFITSELKTAFQIGFIVMIPFLVIDMVVGSVLMSMGMLMMSPAMVALPFKIMLFVLVDGWNLLVGSLLQSFG